MMSPLNGRVYILPVSRRFRLMCILVTAVITIGSATAFLRHRRLPAVGLTYDYTVGNEALPGRQ